MANIWLILLVTVLTVPSVLMSKVSNQTQRLHSTGDTLHVTDCLGSDDSTKESNFLLHFIGRKIPLGLFKLDDPDVVYLCQTYPPKAINYYSTIFDKTSMNAILSAYHVTTAAALLIGEHSARTNYWRSNHEGDGHGGLFPKNHYDDVYRAGKPDAEKYQKGHLLPFSIYSFDGDFGKSTFDYSNAVPQHKGWNQGDWKVAEKAVKRYTQLRCGCRFRGTMYLLTGTSQFAYGKNQNQNLYQYSYYQRPKEKLTYEYGNNHRIEITVPNVMWTAGCCIWTDPTSFISKVESIAVIGNNLPENTNTMATTVHQLQDMLADQNAIPVQKVNLFPGNSDCELQGNSYILTSKSQFL